MTTTNMFAVAAAMLIGLAACSDAGTNEAADNPGAAANAQAEANQAISGKRSADGETAPEGADPAVGNRAGGPSATASSPSAEIRVLLIGHWAADGDCDAALRIAEDGSFASTAAGEGRWELSNEYLTLAGSRETIELAVQEIDRTSMTTINPQGRIGRWTRC